VGPSLRPAGAVYAAGRVACSSVGIWRNQGLLGCSRPLVMAHGFQFADVVRHRYSIKGRRMFDALARDARNHGPKNVERGTIAENKDNAVVSGAIAPAYVGIYTPAENTK
jgi:hypothetical protein